MAWTVGSFFLGANESTGFVFGPYSAPLPLEHFVARPFNILGTLRTELTSVSNEGGPLGVAPLLNIHTGVTNLSDTGTWFDFIGATLS
jgi:hypothetical protein